METGTVDVAGLSLRVRPDGSAGSTPLIFWHGLGFGGNGGFLDVAAPPLVAAGYATVALDAPGFGGSSPLPRDGYADWPDAQPDATIDELIAEVEAEPLPATWDGLVALLAESRLDQDWTLAAWGNGFDVAPDEGMRHMLFADLGEAAGSIVAEWLGTVVAGPSAP